MARVGSKLELTAVDEESKVSLAAEAVMAFRAAAEENPYYDVADGVDSHSTKDIEHDGSSGVPTMAIRMAVKRHAFSQPRAYMRLVLHIIFVSLYVYIVLSVRNIPGSFSIISTLRDLFAEEEFPTSMDPATGEFNGPIFLKNFYDIGNQAELWEWLEGPYVGAFEGSFGPWYNGMQLNGSVGALQQYNFPVYVALRQIRVKAIDCDDGGSDGVCYPAYTEADEEKEVWVGRANSSFTIDWDGGLSALYGTDGFYYGTGGYPIVFTADDADTTNSEGALNPNLIKSTLARLKRNLWTDLQTRAVVADVVVGNTNNRVGVGLRLTVEFRDSGLVVPRTDAFPVPLDWPPYSGDADDVGRLVGEIIFMVLLAINIYHTVREVWLSNSFLAYLSNTLNLIDLLNLTLYVVVVIYWIVLVSTPLDLRDPYTLGSQFIDLNIIASINLLVGFVKIFKFLTISKRMTLLWDTLESAFWELATMALVMMLIIVGYSLVAHVIFGSESDHFKTFSDSVGTLLRASLGDFDYEEMKRVAPDVAPAFFATYTFMVFLVLINMFIAVISDFYELRHEELAKEEEFAEAHDIMSSSVLERIKRQISGSSRSKKKKHETHDHELRDVVKELVAAGDNPEGDVKDMLRLKHALDRMLEAREQEIQKKKSHGGESRSLWDKLEAMIDEMPRSEQEGLMSMEHLEELLGREGAKQVAEVYQRFYNTSSIAKQHRRQRDVDAAMLSKVAFSLEQRVQTRMAVLNRQIMDELAAMEKRLAKS
eukprot:PLAT12717.2.p1 GENE.PLAT12717.2~~PLAT12717.2.p1  ORF type:complete len:778 (-),score=265.90 PLAT12717.2:490-2781(-)